jgi:transcriptional regulator with XRE-family HTH domain
VSLGAALQKERKARRWSQTAAAEAIGKPQQTYCRWERGSRPDEAAWPAIAHFLQVPRDTFSQWCHAWWQGKRPRTAGASKTPRSQEIQPESSDAPATYGSARVTTGTRPPETPNVVADSFLANDEAIDAHREELQQLHQRLGEVTAECYQLQAENRRLRRLLADTHAAVDHYLE